MQIDSAVNLLKPGSRFYEWTLDFFSTIVLRLNNHVEIRGLRFVVYRRYVYGWAVFGQLAYQ